MAGEIFISYRRGRELLADQLESKLREQGYADYQIFRDVRGLFAGESFDQQLTIALRGTKLVLLLLGKGDAPSTRAGDWVAREMRAALDSGRPVLPLALGSGGLAELRKAWPPEFQAIAEKQFLLVSEEITGDELQRLVGALRRRGIRPRKALEKWSAVLAHVPITSNIDDVIARASSSATRTVVVEGQPGTGRSFVMGRVLEELQGRPAEFVVAMHHGLHNRLVGVGSAAVYDWLEGLLRGETSVPEIVVDLMASCLHPRHLSGALLDRCTTAQRLRLRPPPPGSATGDVARETVRMLEYLPCAVGRIVVLMVDDIDLADSGTQEIVRLLIARLKREPALEVRLVLAAASSHLLDLFLQDAGLDTQTGDHRIVLAPSVKEMLEQCGLFDSPTIDTLAMKGLSPSEYPIYLAHLESHCMIALDAGAWSLVTDVTLPSMHQVLDEELSTLYPLDLQEFAEVGAMCGTRFDVNVADLMAVGDDARSRVTERLRTFDQDGVMLRTSEGLGSDRMAFVSSMWWRHLRNRRLTADHHPRDPSEVRRLAECLKEAVANRVDCYDDWATIAFLYDSIGDVCEAGAAFLHAARAARGARANDMAERGYREAARRLELHAITCPPGTERAGELMRAAYCRFRAATVATTEIARSCTQPGAPAQVLAAPGEDLFPDQTLAEVADLLKAIAEELDDAATEPTDFDEEITRGAAVDSELLVRRRLQWRTLRSFVALERGRRSLATKRDEVGQEPTPEPEDQASEEFSAALILGEAGLSGSAYHELAVASCAGLALALSRQEGLTTGSERAITAFEHGARAAMLLARSPYAGSTRATEIDRYAEATEWIALSRIELAEGVGLEELASSPTEESSEEHLMSWLRAAHSLVATRNQPGHAASIVRDANDLLDRAADLGDHRRCDTFARDVEIFAHAHDQFRWTHGARLLRIWRDLSHGDQGWLDAGARQEWRNPTLLHGKVATQWLRLDLHADRIIGESRFSCLAAAIDSHTVGWAEPPPGAAGDFACVVHLADACSRRDDDQELTACWEAAFSAGGLRTAYRDLHALRAHRLRSHGKILSPVTESIAASSVRSVNAPEH